MVAAIAVAGFLSAPAIAGQAHVAVAANFTQAAADIAAAFEAETGHEAVLSFGSTGQIYAQIVQGAPFEVFLAADAERPERAVTDGLAVAENRFTYAIGRIVLWSKDAALVTGPDTLSEGSFNKIAIANPETAPYGAAAVEAMQALGVFETLRPRIVHGNSISQTFQFVETGNAELGFVAASQLAGVEAGSRWDVPAELYEPIRQDAVLLDSGVGDEAAAAFFDFLGGAAARAIIEKYGYAVDPAG